MNLIQQYQMELSKAEKELFEYKLKITRLVNELYECASPFYCDNIETIKAMEIEQIGDELLDIKGKALEVQNKIKRIKSELGK